MSKRSDSMFYQHNDISEVRSKFDDLLCKERHYFDFDESKPHLTRLWN